MTSIRSCGPVGLLFAAALALPLAGLLATPAFAEDEPGSEAPALEEVHVPWVLDFNAAKAQAKRENKHLLINFTGSDWCGWCKKLEGEVFAHKAFLDTATKKYVMVFLDFPRAQELKDKVVDADLNEKLQKDFAVRGFPTIMLANADGHPYARTGYQDGGPENYLTHLDELRGKSAAVDAIAAAGAEKVTNEQLKAGFEVLAEQGLLGYPGYSWVIEKARAVDKDGSLGMKAELDRMAEEKALQDALPKERGQQPDWEKIYGILKDSKHLSGGMFANIAFGTANWLMQNGRPADAKALAMRVKADPALADNERAQSTIQGFIDKCEEAIKAAAEGDKPEEGDGEADGEGK